MMKKKSRSLDFQDFGDGEPGGIRTHDLLIRRKRIEGTKPVDFTG